MRIVDQLPLVFRQVPRWRARRCSTWAVFVGSGGRAGRSGHNGTVTPRRRWQVPDRWLVLVVLVVLVAAGSAKEPAPGPRQRGVLVARTEIRIAPYPGSDTRPQGPVAATRPARPSPVRITACHPSGAPVPLAAVDPAVTARIDRAWSRIERWLAQHAPASYASLRPPASPADLARTQAVLGRRLPAELVASLRRHNGVTLDRTSSFALPPFYTPMSAATIGSDWKSLCDVSQSLGGQVDAQWWSPAYTAFASAGDGGSLLLDQRPGRVPHVGEFFAEDGTNFTRWPASLTDLLELTAQTLQTGQPWNHNRPTVRSGALTWDILP
jgi:cell wall assembly regulator SMI1